MSGRTKNETRVSPKDETESPRTQRLDVKMKAMRDASNLVPAVQPARRDDGRPLGVSRPTCGSRLVVTSVWIDGLTGLAGPRTVERSLTSTSRDPFSAAPAAGEPLRGASSDRLRPAAHPAPPVLAMTIFGSSPREQAHLSAEQPAP